MCKFQSKPQEVLRKRSLGTLRPPWRCPRLASLRIKAHTERRVQPSQPTPSSVWGSQGEQKKGCLTLRITRNINHCFMPLNFRWFHTPNYHFFFSPWCLWPSETVSYVSEFVWKFSIWKTYWEVKNKLSNKTNLEINRTKPENINPMSGVFVLQWAYVMIINLLIL